MFSFELIAISLPFVVYISGTAKDNDRSQKITKPMHPNLANSVFRKTHQRLP